jgi:hypothetical protein
MKWLAGIVPLPPSRIDTLNLTETGLSFPYCHWNHIRMGPDVLAIGLQVIGSAYFL